MKLYNTLTRKKEEFRSIEPGKVNMYVCGPTVYNYIHIGNARPLAVFDTLRRFLEYKGYEVNFALNFTDVDDKIIRRANEEGVSTEVISERYIKAYIDNTTIFHSQMDTIGNVVVPEDRIRGALERSATLEELRDALDLALGQAWDDELEPFRHAGAGAPVRWLNNRVG